MMATGERAWALDGSGLAGYRERGYHVARGMFDAAEVAEIRAYFDELARRGEAVKGGWPTAGERDMAWQPELGSSDPLKRYPRVMHPHYFSELAMRVMLSPRVREVLRSLLGDEPLATQSMYYFKPPGGRGQALHQDNYYLRVKPDTCIAAWLAVDRAYPENGGLWVVPGTHEYEVQCPTLADPEESFTTHYVAPPNGAVPVPAVLEPGDVLFFNGCVVHGSRPNTSRDWRRSFICHYMPSRSTHISGYYGVFDFDGRPVRKERTTDGGPCGTLFGEDGSFPGDWKRALALGIEPVKNAIPG